MKHQFTEDDLKQALRHTAYIDDGLRINIPAWVEDNDEVDLEQVDVFRAILDALPEPEPVADEWEECGPDELRKGDRYLVKGDGWSYEGVVSYSYFNILCTHPATGARLTKAMVKHRRSGLHLFRIPAPVEHPDPEQHPVILIPRFNGVDKEPHLKPFFWNGQHYESFSAPEYFSVQEVTKWSPAKVVPAGDE